MLFYHRAGRIVQLASVPYFFYASLFILFLALCETRLFSFLIDLLSALPGAFTSLLLWCSKLPSCMPSIQIRAELASAGEYYAFL